MGHHPIRRGAAIVLAVTAITVLASCGDDDESTTTDSPSAETGAPAGDDAVLTIQGSTFSSPTVAAGTQITITNNDSFTHTVTSDDGAFETVSVAGGSTGTLTLDEPGSYDYHCQIHSTMMGTIVVN